MRGHTHTFFYSWIAIYIATALSASHAQTLPSTQPSLSPIVEFTLDDPLTPESQCYLDLDTGKTYPRGELVPDMIEQRHWIAAQGIDLMCETRPPSEGFVTYGLAVIETDKSIDSQFDYDGVLNQLQATEPQPFDLVNQGPTPKTYEFRTSDRSIGVMEVSARQNPTSGLRIRFKFLHAPPLPFTSGRQHQLGWFAQIIQAQQQLLRTISADQKTQINSVQSGIELLQKQSDIFAKEPDMEIAVDKMQLLALHYLADSFRQPPGKPDPFIDEVKQRIAETESTMTILERTRNSPSDRTAELKKLDQTEENHQTEDLVRQYDQAHPVVNPALKELTDSQKIARMEKSNLDDQLERAEKCKQRVEELMSPEGQSTIGFVNDHVLRSELNRYSQLITVLKSAQLEADRRYAPKPDPVPIKPTTFPSASELHL